jgi:hypothetical protein
MYISPNLSWFSVLQFSLQLYINIEYKCVDQDTREEKTIFIIQLLNVIIVSASVLTWFIKYNCIYA